MGIGEREIRVDRGLTYECIQDLNLTSLEEYFIPNYKYSSLITGF